MMPPSVPEHFLLAKKRMRQGLHPAVIAAAERSLNAQKGRLSGPDATTLPNDPGSIRRFQRFHGLEGTGAIDPATRALMQRVRTTLAPNAGAGRQVYAGTGVNRQARPVTGGDARSAINPLAGQRYKSYLQRDPEGGIREVHVYGSGEDRQVRAFNRRGPVSSSLMQQLSNTATAEDKLLAIAARRAAAGAGGKGLPKKRVFNYRGGGLSRNV